MQSGAIRHILEIKKKDWTKKLMMFDKKNSWSDNILEKNHEYISMHCWNLLIINDI